MEKLIPLAKEYNKNKDNKGVVFTEEDAFMATPQTLVRWTWNESLKAPSPFFSGWGMEWLNRSTLTYGIEGISECLQQMENGGFDVKVRIPLANLWNKIAKIFPTDNIRKRVRVTVKYNNGEVYNDCRLMKCVKLDNGDLGLFAEEKIYFPHQYSLIEDIEEGKIYQCSIIEDEDNLVSVSYNYFRGIEFLLYESPAGFFPDTDLYSSFNYDNEYKLQLPMLDENFEYFEKEFSPIQVPCKELFDLLNLYRGFNFIDMYLDESKPLMMTGVREDNGYPFIQSILHVLDPDVRGHIC